MACFNGNRLATACSGTGICATGKKTPESSKPGVRTSVKK
jgi:hypothetical protein